MELKKEMFFNADDEIDAKNVANMILQHPNDWEKIIRFIGDLMTDELEFKYEKKWLKEKYHQRIAREVWLWFRWWWIKDEYIKCNELIMTCREYKG